MFPFVLCFLFVSRLNVLDLCFFLLVPPLSYFVCFLLPGPRVRLKRKIMERTTISFVCLSGIFAKMSFAKNNCFCCLWWIFLSTEHVFVRYPWNTFFWYLVKSLLSVQLVSCASIFWIRVLCSCFFVLGGASASFEFCWVLFFCFAYLPHLGLLFFCCCVVVLVLFNFMSWLLVLACGFWWFHFVVNLVGGSFG